MGPQSAPSRLVSILVAVVLLSSSAGHARGGDGLPDYWGESTWLGSPPGVSSDLAAGLFNPAVYAMSSHNGLYFGWRNNRALRLRRNKETLFGASDDLAGILSLRNLAFSYQRFDPKEDFRSSLPPGDPAVSGAMQEYSLSLGGGDRSSAFALAYSWVGGNRELLPRHKRLSAGLIERGRHLSVGLSGNWDVENGDFQGQADLGVKPLGDRWTLFGELESSTGNPLRGGYGLRAYLFRGVRASARYRDGGNYSIGFALSFGSGARFSAAGHGDGDHRTQETYSVQLGGQGEPSLFALADPGSGGVRRMEWKGSMPYRRYRLLDDRPTFVSVLRSIARAAQSPVVKTLLINLSGIRVSREQMWELREQLEAFQGTGGRVVIYADRLGLGAFMLASVADELWLDPQGDLDLRGISWGRTYYRRALDKLGLGVEEWRFFKYKSAFEVLSRSGQSEADRAQRQMLIDDYYEEMRAKITASRNISPEQFDRIVDTRGYILPEEALELKLVDRLGGFRDALESAKKAERPRSKPARDSLLTAVLGDPAWESLRWGEPDAIAVFYAIGECAMDHGIKGRRLSREIEKARKNPKVKAVVLRVDSPGGDPLPSDLVARELLKTMQVKPVVVSQGNVAASGGYWLSMYSNELLASPLTLTGSIGVIGGWIWDDGFGDKIGFDYSQVQRGRHADMGGGILLPFLGVTLPERPLDAAEHERMERIIRGTYADFVAQVAKGRRMSEAAVDSIAQGRIWSGTRGKRIGLVDELGGLWKALGLAKELAEIPADEGVRLVEGPPLGWINPALFETALRPGLGSARVLDPLSGEVRSSMRGWMGLSEEEFDYLRSVFGRPGRPVLRTPPVEIHDGSPTD